MYFMAVGVMGWLLLLNMIYLIHIDAILPLYNML